MNMSTRKTERNLIFHCILAMSFKVPSMSWVTQGVDWLILNRVIDALVQQDVLTWED